MAGAELPSSLSSDPPPDPPNAPEPPNESGGEADEPATGLAAVSARFTLWAERWLPDAFIFALIATALVFLGGVYKGFGPVELATEWGNGFWKLIPFAMQMALIIIGGYVVATTKPVYWLIARLAALPKTPRGAVAMVTLFAMLSSWFNWGFSLIFSAMLAKEVARRKLRVDYRALAASAFLGLGSVWAQGLSGSAALQMATKGALQPAIRNIVAGKGQIPGGMIPLTHTIFLWQSLVSVAVELVVVTTLMYFAAPTGKGIKTAADMGIDLGPSPLDAPPIAKKNTPGEWLEHNPILVVVFVAISSTYLVHYFSTSGKGLSALNVNAINLIFLTLGFALHGTPARLMRAFREATPGVWGVILQFPFYAGIAKIITKTKLSHALAGLFVKLSSPLTFPALVAIYSAVLGVFVPSGGSKWVIEAPYVMQAAHEQQVHLGWMVAVYDLGEALANLVQPFWMLPVLGLFRLRSRDVMGYTFLVFLVLTPVVLALVTALGMTLRYPL